MGPIAWGITAAAAPWEHVPDPVWQTTAEWTQEVELADVDDDGDLDVVLANGGGYSSAGRPEPTRLLVNDGAGAFVEVPLPVPDGLHRVARIRDFDGDGIRDLILPGAWQTPSVLLLGDGAGGFVDASDRLPPDPLSVGDAEPGDVDGDGDLDLVLSDSGPGNALFGEGEITRLWLNELDGPAGAFVDATAARMPDVRVGWSWDLELADLDADLDLDLLISCKTCPGSLLFANDGTGVFVDVSASLPQRTNNYEFEALDLTGDDLPDLVTINDGPGLTERILVNTGSAFEDGTEALLPPEVNIGEDDNVAVMLDYDSDGDIDVLIGSLSGPDRLLVNDGTGRMSLVEDALSGPPTRGTLALAVGDLDGDGRSDVVMGQGEAASADLWYRGVDVPRDTQPPVIAPLALPDPIALPLPVLARVHDRKSPVTPDDAEVALRWEGSSGSGEIRMAHSGHVLWRAVLDADLAPGSSVTLTVCATDRAGNRACSEPSARTVAGEPSGTPTTEPSTGEPTGPEADPPDVSASGGGCGCGSRPPASWTALGALLALLRARRRADQPAAASYPSSASSAPASRSIAAIAEASSARSAPIG